MFSKTHEVCGIFYFLGGEKGLIAGLLPCVSVETNFRCHVFSFQLRENASLFIDLVNQSLDDIINKE